MKLLPVLLLSLLAAFSALASENGGYGRILKVDHLVLTDMAPNREIALRLRYPAEPGSYPLIVFSHGAMSSPDRYDLLTDFWAANGYVVIAPVHPDSPALGKVDPRQMSRFVDIRKSDMTLVLDNLDQIAGKSPGLSGRIDTTRIAAAGHSLGALISMAVTGLTTKNAEGVAHSVTDDRFDLAILLSGPGQMPVIPDDAWQDYSAPSLLITGTKDVSTFNKDNPAGWRWHLAAIEKTPPGGKFGLIIEGLEHSLGGLICCNAPNQGEPDVEGLEIVRTVSTRYLDTFMKSDGDASPLFRPEVISQESGGRAQLLAN